jgi:translation elongation factor EF-Ts
MTDPETITLSFYECEHQGDLNHYISDLKSSGATIVDKRINREAEVGTVDVEVNNRTKFIEAFKKTDAYHFLN